MDKHELNEQMLIRRDKLNFFKENNLNPYANGHKPTYSNHLVEENFERFTKEELDADKTVVSIGGRVMTKRGQGKAGFATCRDFTGDLQLYVASANITELQFEIWNKIDLGDIIFAEGEIMKTKVGALAIRVTNLVMLSKSLRPLPEKHHGLTDKEERYRRRYIDLIVNEDTQKTFISRSKIISGMREDLNHLDYLEVETPTLQCMPGGAAAEPFVTHHNTLDVQMYLRVAPELYLKKLVVGGFPRVYEIGKQFRNEGMSIKHNPEFTSIEIYAMYEDVGGMMELTEKLIQNACLRTNDSLHIEYEEIKLDLTTFRRVHMVDLIKEYTNVDFFIKKDIEEARNLASVNKVHLKKHHISVGHIINEFFEQICEEKLVQPTFVFGHPIEVSPLSRVNDEDNRFTERFELFIAGREYANAFSELNDPIDQLNRFEAQSSERELGNAEAHEIDYDFIAALEYGMTPTGGLGIGVDRLVMLLTNATSIRDVIFFPTMKQKK